RVLRDRLCVHLVPASISSDPHDAHLHLLSLRPRGAHDRLAGWRVSESVKTFWLAALFVVGCRTTVPIEWTAYGHHAAGTRHSPATQITPDNASKLEVTDV